MITEKNNYYIGHYRIVHISNKWRICIQNKKDFTKWDFINTIEYNTAGDAINDLPEI